MPFEAGSRRLLPALLSTKPLLAGSVGLLILLPPADLVFCQQEGHVSIFVWPEKVLGMMWQRC